MLLTIRLMVKSINKLLEIIMRVKFFNIEWDIEYEGADILTDEIGYCVVSFEFEIIGE
jgi:hypothetical protein